MRAGRHLEIVIQYSVCAFERQAEEAGGYKCPRAGPECICGSQDVAVRIFQGQCMLRCQVVGSPYIVCVEECDPVITAGFDAFIAKPFDIEELLRIVYQCFDDKLLVAAGG